VCDFTVTTSNVFPLYTAPLPVQTKPSSGPRPWVMRPRHPRGGCRWRRTRTRGPTSSAASRTTSSATLSRCSPPWTAPACRPSPGGGACCGARRRPTPRPESPPPRTRARGRHPRCPPRPRSPPCAQLGRLLRWLPRHRRLAPVVYPRRPLGAQAPLQRLSMRSGRRRRNFVFAQTARDNDMWVLATRRQAAGHVDMVTWRHVG
jgi:hypothetical protein